MTKKGKKESKNSKFSGYINYYKLDSEHGILKTHYFTEISRDELGKLRTQFHGPNYKWVGEKVSEINSKESTEEM